MSSETLDRRPFLGALMRHSWQWVWQQIVTGVLAAGYDDITAAHIGMFRHPSLDGQRPTQLADQLQITKQSVNDLLGHLEHAGYITRQPDPADRRARVDTTHGQRPTTRADHPRQRPSRRPTDRRTPRHPALHPTMRRTRATHRPYLHPPPAMTWNTGWPTVHVAGPASCILGGAPPRRVRGQCRPVGHRARSPTPHLPTRNRGADRAVPYDE